MNNTTAFMKNHLILAITIFVMMFLFPIAPNLYGQTSAEERKQIAEYVKANYTKRETMIPMRDGVKLFTVIYEPKNESQKYPILFFRTPYHDIGPVGANNVERLKSSLGPGAPDKYFAKEGYIFALQDVRGRWLSEGEFQDMRPETARFGTKETDESTDAYDTVDWLIKNVGNNNGRVGTYGSSYSGFYSSAGLINSHPAIKAAIPQAPIGDWFHGDDMHHNGAFYLAQNYDFFAGFGQFRPAPTSSGDYEKPFNFGTQDGYKFYMEMGGLKNSGDIYQKQLGMRIKFWDEMMAHPNYDQFWKDRNVLPKLKNIKAAVMTVGGWYDNEDLFGALNTYKSIEKQNPGIFNVLVIGPWGHGGWSGQDGDWMGTAYFGQKTGEWYREKMEVPFFNYFLKDKGDTSNIKEVNLFDTGANEWHNFNGYEPNNVTNTPIYLTSGGKLSFTKPDNSGKSYDEYISDPLTPVPYTQKISLSYPHEYMTEDQRFVSTRPDVLVYQTEPLIENIAVAGDIKPQLFVSSSGTDADYIVKLIDVFPDDYQYPENIKPPENSMACVFEPGGYEMLLRAEPFPARFRNSFGEPEALLPDQITKISFVMPGITHTFKKGHRIMVQIQSTMFPLIARNPQKFVANYKQAANSDFLKAVERIYHNQINASNIVLPIVKN